MSAPAAPRRGPVPAGFGLTGSSRSLDELLAWIARAERLGFAEIQLQPLWNPLLDEELAAIEAALDGAGLSCPSIGVYSDLLRPESPHIFNTTERELRRVLEWMPRVGARSAIVWAGTYGRDLLDGDPRNIAPESRRRLDDHLERLQPLLRTHDARLLIEPWYSHALQTERELAAFCGRHGETVGIVMDVANLIRPTEWPDREARLASIVEHLLPHCGIVHLKDMSVADDGSFDLPFCGRGAIDFDLVLELLRPVWRRVPFLVEHVSNDEDALAATAFVIRAATRAGYELGEA